MKSAYDHILVSHNRLQLTTNLTIYGSTVNWISYDRYFRIYLESSFKFKVSYTVRSRVLQGL